MPAPGTDRAGAASSLGARSPVAIILPRNRLREWHRQLIAHLGRTREVDVFLDDRAPPYPLAMRLWLKLEQLAFGDCSLMTPIPPEAHWRPVPALEDLHLRSIINLSERPSLHRDALEIYFEGALDSYVLASRLPSLKSPCLTVQRAGHPESLARSSLAIQDRSSVSRGLQAVFARCISLIERGLEIGAGAGAAAIAAVPPRSSSVLAFIPQLIARRALNLMMRPFWRREHWHVALRDGARTFKVVQDDGKRFYADPFIQARQGRKFLFVEEFPYDTRRGIISVAEISGDEILAPPVPVLRRPYHLSYPFVFEHGSEIFMMPESGENRTLELYRAVDFPWKWELSRVLMEGTVFSDATMLFHHGLWWLFVTADPMGASTQDELSIFYSETLRGNWTAHRMNPVKSDSRSSRPAGRIVQQNGRLFRPAQDCEQSYGAGIVWFEIIELSPERFVEREIVAWDGRTALGTTGVHSFDQLGGLQAIDFKCPVGRGWLRRRHHIVAPRSGGNMDISFGRDSHELQFDQIANAMAAR